MAACRRMQMDSYLPLCPKLNSDRMKNPSVRSDAPSLLKENIGNRLDLIGTGKDFLDRTLLAQAQSSQIDNETP